MNLLKILIASSAILLISNVDLNAQSIFNNQNSKTINPIELYQNKMFMAAKIELEKLEKEIDINKQYKSSLSLSYINGYKVLCSIALNDPNTEGLILAYESSYPSSALLAQIKFKYGSSIFDKGDYSNALRFYAQINIKSLYNDQKPEYLFRAAYYNMRAGNNTEAKIMFTKLLKSTESDQKGFSTQYKTPSQYYLGYLAYIEKDFKTAIPFFTEAKKDARFNSLSQYHIFESKFMLKDYNYVIKNGNELYNNINDTYKAKVARILSEAYFENKDSEKAKYYYELYSLAGENITRADNFYAGIIAYSMNMHLAAVESFSKVASTTDSLGQSAYYYMGNSHIQLKNKYAAQEAFKKASESSFDINVKEDAYFNYAKLSFDINKDISPFKTYLASYHFSQKKWDEIHNYMATAFILGKDYEQALKAFSEIKGINANVITNTQKAAFLRGIQLLDNGAYSAAAPYFKRVIDKGNHNINLVNLSKFWLAECLYRANDFRESINLLTELQQNAQFKKSTEYSSSYYNAGYAYFKLKDFDAAIASFKHYFQFTVTQRTYYKEAKLRMADCYFMKKEYMSAAEIYEKYAIEDNYNSLYAPLQSAICYGLLSQEDKKIALLREITTTNNISDPLYSQAVYELGRTLVQSVKDEEAIKVFNILIDTPKDSTYYYKAMLEMGMIYSNLQQNDKALAYYKKIVEKNPISEEAQNALSGIENIYQNNNRSEEFLSYLDNIGLSKVKTAGEKETMLFNSAEQTFLSGDYTAALNSLNRFLKNYPNGQYSTQVYFYIAECYNKSGKFEYAADAYHRVMENGEGAFSEIATLNYGRICFKLERWEQAIKAYETLSQIAKLDNNKLEAAQGKMKSYYSNKDYSVAIKEADNLINMFKPKQDIIQEANYIKAKCYLASGERKMANEILRTLAKKPSTVYGAEASYLLILDAYDAGDFTKVEKLTFILSDSRTPQSYWLAKSFIVLGDSYMERDNKEQAFATFNSIKDNYDKNAKDDIIDLIKIRLNKLNK